MSKLVKSIDSIEAAEQRLSVKKFMLLDRAIKSNDPGDIIKAQSYINNLIENREESERKSYLIDPLDFVSSLGFKDKAMGLTYGTLRRMAVTPIINAIIKTRINQVAAFAEVQKDKYSTGFKVFKKGKEHSKLNKAEEARAREIEEFLLNCGRHNSWENDDFDTFIRKITKDSLIYDQMTFEVVRDRKGVPYEFVATDASTYRIADSIDDDNYHKGLRKQIKGYYPSYVQIDQGNVVAEFYPWELCFGVRNADTNINNFGYGISELEELIHTITAFLWAEEYNRRFFSQGSAPKGIIRVDGSISPGKIQEFKQQWQAMISGVYNSWKTPIMEAGKMEFVNLQGNNRDMEFSKWLEYLIKVSCSIYTIDPAEINFPVSGGEGAKTVFESNNEAKLQHSKDKGLYPLLKFVQHRLNKFIVSQIDPEYYVQFVGMDALTKTEELELVVKKVTNVITLNEAREELGYKPLKDETAENVMSSTFAQFKQQEQQAQMGAQQPGMPGGEDMSNYDFGQQSEDKNPFGNE